MTKIHTYNLPFQVVTENESEGVTALELWNGLHRKLDELAPTLGKFNDIHDVCGYPINTEEKQ